MPLLATAKICLLAADHPLAKSAVAVIQEDPAIDERAERQRAESEMQNFVRNARRAARRGGDAAAPLATGSLSRPMRGSATPGLGGSSAAGLDHSGMLVMAGGGFGGEAFSWTRGDKVEHLAFLQRQQEELR